MDRNYRLRVALILNALRIRAALLEPDGPRLEQTELWLRDWERGLKLDERVSEPCQSA